MNDQNELLLVTTPQITQFERGFKTWAENTASSIRVRLGLSKYSPLSPYLLASHIKAQIITPKEILGLSSDTIDYLTSEQGDEWSAVTLKGKSVSLIIINPFHSKRRQANTLMHELSHIIRDHKATRVFINDDGITMRDYDRLQEAEADWLGGTLLLPRDVLVHCHFKHYSIDEACKIYEVSKSLYNYRLRMSGVSKQFKK